MPDTDEKVELGRTSHWVAEHDRKRGLVRFQRTHEPLVDVTLIRAQSDATTRMLRGLDRSDLGLLVDLRLCPLRNDADYENSLGGKDMGQFKGFSKVVVLVRTEVAKLQVMRLGRERGNPIPVVTTEIEAVSAASTKRPSRR